jgi:hypothetical protein
VSNEKDPKLHVRIEDLAVPEVLTGTASETDELEDGQEEIRYDNVAVPEIHLSGKKLKK